MNKRRSSRREQKKNKNKTKQNKREIILVSYDSNCEDNDGV